MYHFSVVCNHCKTLVVKEIDTDQSELFIREKQYDSKPTVAYLHQQIPLEKFSTQLSILCEQMHHLLVISTALRFKLVKKMIHATKNLPKTIIIWFARRKVSSCINYVALNLYANICLHHQLKGLNISTAAASQGKTANRKVSSLRHL